MYLKYQLYIYIISYYFIQKNVFIDIYIYLSLYISYLFMIKCITYNIPPVAYARFFNEEG